MKHKHCGGRQEVRFEPQWRHCGCCCVALLDCSVDFMTLSVTVRKPLTAINSIDFPAASLTIALYAAHYV